MCKVVLESEEYICRGWGSQGHRMCVSDKPVIPRDLEEVELQLKKDR